MIGDLAERLRAEAARANQRRMLVVAGDREADRAAAVRALDAAGISAADTTLVADPETAWPIDCERVGVDETDALLGRTRDAVVLDCHVACRPNAIGRAVGAVDGGGLLVLVTPQLDDWPTRSDGFDQCLAAPPASVSAVTGHFRERLVRTLRAHRGIAIADVDRERVEREGLTDPPPRRPREPPAVPADTHFPRAAYEACLSAGQADALGVLGRLRDPGTAVVLEADRGRGKSSAVGLAAGALAAAGRDVLVTGPHRESTAEVFARTNELLVALDAPTVDDVPGAERDASTRAAETTDPPDCLETATGGRVRYAAPTTAAADPTGASAADVVLVDEAAALPVGVLEALLDAADAIAFATTVHGYEGAGRGFAVRFRDHLDASSFTVAETDLQEPIRYAPSDPIEVWAFRALLLDARPPVEPLIAEATTETVEYERLSPGELLADEHTLREVFGLLVAAHYRTEPDDLARLLDAPNVSVRALTHGGHVVAVALLAREGGLSAERREAIYEGARVKGNLLPDVLTSQLRDEDAAESQGLRVLRIATHHAARSRGLGSHLLDATFEEFASASEVDWLGVGYGATPDLLRFWRVNGFRSVHLAMTRNERSGEHSVLMLAPLSAAGERLHDRHARWFVERVGSAVGDALSAVDPDVVRGVLRATDPPVKIDLSAHDWRTVASAAYGPGLARIDPRPFRHLALAALVGSPEQDGRDEGTAEETESDERTDAGGLSTREERLLVLRVLQHRPPERVADRLGYDSTAECMRALGRAYQVLVDRWGTESARAERARYVE